MVLIPDMENTENNISKERRVNNASTDINNQVSDVTT